jgi:endo-1,3-1,4-beta-glycanase ExoK
MNKALKIVQQITLLNVAIILLGGCVQGPLAQGPLKQGTASAPTAYAGYTGIYPGFSLVLDERFDSFNNNIWKKGDGAVGGEAICRFQPQGVQVTQGYLHLIINKEPIVAGWSDDHQQDKGPYQFSCGEIRSRENKKMKYGRIETRMKAPKREVASGYISSLFTYTNEGDPREWEEIDVELEGGRPDKFQANLIYGKDVWAWWATRKWGAWEDKIDIAPADEWRVYAIEWTPTMINWFVDGVLIKTLDEAILACKPACIAPQIHATPIPNNLTQLMMNFWIPNDEIEAVFGGPKKDNIYPMKTQYDWFRLYQLDKHPFTQW